MALSRARKRDGHTRQELYARAQRRHIEGLGAADEIAEAGQPVEQAVLGVRVQMDEVLGDDLPHDVPLEEARRRFSEV